MKRITIMLPEDLKIRALRKANILGLSLGGFIRESLELSLRSNKSGQLSEDPLFTDDAVYQKETPRDLAVNHDDYLYGDQS